MKHPESRRAWLAPSFLLCALLAGLSASSPAIAAATPPGRAIQVTASNTVSTLPAKSKRWALVIGVDQYDDPNINALGGANNDAKAIAEALRLYAGFPEEQILLFTSDQTNPSKQPRKNSILTAFFDLQARMDKDGLLFVSFAGHGIERDGKGYLLVADSRLSDVRLIEETSISVERMQKYITDTGVKQVMLTLDACRNDPQAGRSVGRNTLGASLSRGFKFDEVNSGIDAFVTLYATQVGASAYEYREKQQGYFTYGLIEGLKGGAANARGEVTLGSLVDYVQTQVPKMVQRDLGIGQIQKPFNYGGGYQADKLVVAVVPRNSRSNYTTPGSSTQSSRIQPTVASPGSAGNTSPTQGDASANEALFWSSIKDSTNPEDFRSYLARYPNGLFSDLARRRTQTQVATVQQPQRTTTVQQQPATSVQQPPAAPANPPKTQTGGAVNAAIDSFMAGLINSAVGSNGNPVRTAAPTGTARAVTGASIYQLGYYLGYAELATYQGAAINEIQGVLGSARQIAATTNIAVSDINAINSAVAFGYNSQSQYQQLTSLRQNLEQQLNVYGNCGRTVVLRNLFVLGSLEGFIEIVAYQNSNSAYLQQLLTAATQYAAAAGMPTANLTAMSARLQNGESPGNQYQAALTYRNSVYQLTQFNCTY